MLVSTLTSVILFFALALSAMGRPTSKLSDIVTKRKADADSLLWSDVAHYHTGHDSSNTVHYTDYEEHEYDSDDHDDWVYDPDYDYNDYDDSDWYEGDYWSNHNEKGDAHDSEWWGREEEGHCECEDDGNHHSDWDSDWDNDCDDDCSNDRDRNDWEDSHDHEWDNNDWDSDWEQYNHDWEDEHDAEDWNSYDRENGSENGWGSWDNDRQDYDSSSHDWNDYSNHDDDSWESDNEYPYASQPYNGALNLSAGASTVYEQHGRPGSCGEVYDDEAFVCALGNAWMNHEYRSEKCGRRIRVTNLGSHYPVGGEGRSIIVTVKDTCESCDKDHIDLSIGAWNALTDYTAPGLLNIQWAFI